MLDEPTNGLDPQGTREIRSLIRELAAGGVTVFVSSHLLAEVEQVCSHVGIMSAGGVAQGTVREFQAGRRTTVHVTPDLPRRAGAGRPRPGRGVDVADGGHRHPQPSARPPLVVAALVTAACRSPG